ncbi:ABC transporter substrate-binding protein [Thermodesulfobacteriota bacterium]
MKEKMIKKTFVVLMMMVFIVGFVCHANAAEKKKIAISMIPHLTGAYSGSFQGILEGFEDCIEYLNSINYVPGVELVMLWADGATDTAKTLAGFKKLLAEKPKPVAVIGCGTPFSLALKKACIKNKVPDLSAGSDDSFGFLPSWTFSAQLPYPNMAGAWVDYYLEHLWKDKSRKPRFAFLTWDNAAGRNFTTKNVKNYIKSKGVEIVSEEYIPIIPTDTTPQLMRLKQKKVDFTFGGMFFTTISVVLKDMQKLGMIDKIKMGYWWSAYPSLLIKKAGALANGIYFTNDRYWTEEISAEKGFVPWKIYEAKRKGKFAYNMYYAGGWYYPMLAAEAIRIATADVGADKVDGTAVYKALQKMKGFDVLGTSLPVSFGPERRFGITNQTLMSRIKGGKNEYLGAYPAPDLRRKK